MSEEPFLYRGNILGCGCVIVACGIALALLGISLNAVEIAKIIWK